jgi:hypothetical protein
MYDWRARARSGFDGGGTPPGSALLLDAAVDGGLQVSARRLAGGHAP